MTVKILVANRSEIACRVFQTCREMGLKTVGIVAPGDEEARHLTYADEVFPVASYLDISSILQVAKKAGVQAVHPGYGFLSERSAFARAVEEAELVFIGPRPETMDLMGGKIAAKELAAHHKISTLPWAQVKKGTDLAAAAKQVGFPLLLKASAGGGGKGMRRVDRVEDLQSAAESAGAEAVAAFGDGTLFLERWVDRPRHIEVQVFGDGKGGGIHFFERECSLQRRHQKVWEEAPAPHLKEETRKALFDAALRLVSATHYRSAGTIEFLVDANESFYFLEMNTRLQVEHPVTECVTGIDLVWAQIAQALSADEFVLKHFLENSVNHSGKDSMTPRGHAIEVRLYAEDPAQGFIPSPGRVERLRWPTGAGIRIESGIEEGQRVGIEFDSLLGKLIVYAQNREHALARLKFALEETVILGVGTNQSYLRSLIDHPQVRQGRVDTGFLSSQSGELGREGSFLPLPTSEDLDLLMALRSSGWVDSPHGISNSDQNQDSPSPWTAFSKRGVGL